MSIARKSFIVIGCLAALLGFYVLSAGRLVLNASDSLPGHAYAMFSWPKITPRGAVVAMKLPEVLRKRVDGEDIYLTKRIAGLSGDEVQADEHELCVNGRCVLGQIKDGKLVAPIWQGSEVPQGSVLLLGESEDSLDSRYAVIGPRPVSEIVAVGFEIPFPHWKELPKWLR